MHMASDSVLVSIVMSVHMSPWQVQSVTQGKKEKKGEKRKEKEGAENKKAASPKQRHVTTSGTMRCTARGTACSTMCGTVCVAVVRSTARSCARVVESRQQAWCTELRWPMCCQRSMLRGSTVGCPGGQNLFHHLCRAAEGAALIDQQDMHALGYISDLVYQLCKEEEVFQPFVFRQPRRRLPWPFVAQVELHAPTCA